MKQPATERGRAAALITAAGIAYFALAFCLGKLAEAAAGAVIAAAVMGVIWWGVRWIDTGRWFR